ncbi:MULTISPECIES: phospholipase D family protein [unclassified Moraxella]|uniref:phospholipase D family protein n=1 Tax=unclassified Moraxella TaxID=2685852 RepID=UPI003AF6B514
MAKFLNTSGTTYHLEELIKKASDRLILISPFLKLNDRIKELLEDKNRLKIDIRIIYGKSDLQPEEINWLKNLDFVRTSFCKNLHAKCYLNENEAIITSLNLYEFSQVNNNEMGVLISRQDDSQLYHDTYEEVQRIIRISDEIKVSAEKPQAIANPVAPNVVVDDKVEASPTTKKKVYDKLTTSKLAEKLGMATPEFTTILEQLGYVEMKGKTPFLTDKGREAGGELKKGQYGYFIIWSVDMNISIEEDKNTNVSWADKLLKLFQF